MKKFLSYRFALFVLVVIVASYSANAQSGDVISHDPVMIKAEGVYYVFGSGKNIPVKSSRDMKTWKEEKPVFSVAPQWINATVPKSDGSMWAPDIHFFKGTYYLFYSVSTFGRNNSAIGVATNKTLDATSASFKWEDHGIVVQSVPGRDMWNAIDPNLAFDEKGTPWLALGSFWEGLKIVKLQDNLLAPVKDTTQEWHTLAARQRNWLVDERDAGDAANPELNYSTLYTPELLESNKNMKNGSIEAAFIFKKNDMYYLFASWDRCCKGLESTYKVVVGRSKTITGPYVDKSGTKMIHGGGTIVVQGDNDWAAAGHEAAYTIDGVDYLIFHAYDKNDKGKPKLRIREMKWDAQGWPVVTMK